MPLGGTTLAQPRGQPSLQESSFGKELPNNPSSRGHGREAWAAILPRATLPPFPGSSRVLPCVVKTHKVCIANNAESDGRNALP